MKKSILSLVIASGIALSVTNVNIANAATLGDHSVEAYQQKVISTFNEAQIKTAVAKAIGNEEGHSAAYFAATREAKEANERAIAARAWYVANLTKAAPSAMAEIILPASELHNSAIDAANTAKAIGKAEGYSPEYFAAARDARDISRAVIASSDAGDVVDAGEAPTSLGHSDAAYAQKVVSTFNEAQRLKAEAIAIGKDEGHSDAYFAATRRAKEASDTAIAARAWYVDNVAEPASPAMAEVVLPTAELHNPAIDAANTAKAIGKAEGYSPEYLTAARDARDISRAVITTDLASGVAAPTAKAAQTAAPVATALISEAATAAPLAATSMSSSDIVIAIDKRINTQSGTQKKTDAAQDTVIAGKLDTSKYQSGQDAQNTRIDKVATMATDNGTNIVKAQNTADKAQSTATANGKLITTNTQGVAANKAAAADNGKLIAGNTASIHDEVTRAKAAEYKNSQAITHTNSRVTKNEQRLDNHESRIGDLEAGKGFGNKFNDLKNQVESNRKHASAGTSSAMAMANIPQVLQGQTFAVGAGIGGYDGENGVAVGFSARVTESVVVKATVSDDSQQNFGYGAGVSIGW